MLFFKDKSVLITGCCGTVGKELVRQFLDSNVVKELVGIDNNESELFFLEQKYINHPNSSFFLADVRDSVELHRKFKGIDIVFHTAAFKHVILSERSPFEAVQTNILGVENVIDAACESGVERVIFTSSDKAVNPTNVMGTSKLMGERLITAANSTVRGKGPIFASTRFGNVLGSRGSVIPIFRNQIMRGEAVTLTDPGMTRFIMSIAEAARLVIDSAQLAQGGEVFVTKMPVIQIKDLAEVMIQELAPLHGYEPTDIPINIIGSKAGEKMYEELLSHEETRRTYELPQYFAIIPAFRGLYRKIRYEYHDIVSTTVDRPYNSAQEAYLDKSAIASFLHENNLLSDSQ
ncbi:polysaccharide biosynthesis protein [Desulfogranum japonicum]|uniref:polysaccharide biosynthesis protein n=1 Tax=Desulfogranum japonicum TaxID=231447 RepID=UPI000421D24E|nr:polysaccharide biosynthesis protein [Desulfogranum japonicum]